MKTGQMVFVDSGAWIALALERDAFHTRARSVWQRMNQLRVTPCSSIPVVLETFTFLERNTERDMALTWRTRISEIRNFKILECRKSDLEAAWAYFKRKDLHKLSATDATSFAIMERRGIRTAFTFDHHFAVVGFELTD